MFCYKSPSAWLELISFKSFWTNWCGYELSVRDLSLCGQICGSGWAHVNVIGQFTVNFGLFVVCLEGGGCEWSVHVIGVKCSIIVHSPLGLEASLRTMFFETAQFAMESIVSRRCGLFSTNSRTAMWSWNNSRKYILVPFGMVSNLTAIRLLCHI